MQSLPLFSPIYHAKFALVFSNLSCKVCPCFYQFIMQRLPLFFPNYNAKFALVFSHLSCKVCPCFLPFIMQRDTYFTILYNNIFSFGNLFNFLFLPMLVLLYIIFNIFVVSHCVLVSCLSRNTCTLSYNNCY